MKDFSEGELERTTPPGASLASPELDDAEVEPDFEGAETTVRAPFTSEQSG